MLDIKLIRESPEVVKKDLLRRPNFDTSIVDKVLEADAVWRTAKGELDKLKAQKNKESKAIAEVKKSGGDIKAQIAKVKEVADAIAAKDEELKSLESVRDEIMFLIPNILDPEVPTGEDKAILGRLNSGEDTPKRQKAGTVVKGFEFTPDSAREIEEIRTRALEMELQQVEELNERFFNLQGV